MTRHRVCQPEYATKYFVRRIFYFGKIAHFCVSYFRANGESGVRGTKCDVLSAKCKVGNWPRLPGFENKSGQLRAFKNNSLRAIARIAHFYYYLVGGNLKGLKHMFFHVFMFPQPKGGKNRANRAITRINIKCCM